MQRHNVSRGCNSLQLLFKIYCSLIAGFLSLPGGFSVEIGSLFQVCICECDDNAKVTSDQLVPRCENTTDAFKKAGSREFGLHGSNNTPDPTGMLRTASIQ